MGELIWVVALASALAVYWAMKRALLGPKLVREDWALYRAPGDVSISLDAILQPLQRHGYRPVLTGVVGADGAPDHAVLRQEGVRHGGVAIDLRALGSRGVGLIEASDTGNGMYEEMAKYAIYELGKIIPGLTFRGALSALTAESTDTLEPQLPDRPHCLPR